jgi:hypothetical protein
VLVAGLPPRPELLTIAVVGEKVNKKKGGEWHMVTCHRVVMCHTGHPSHPGLRPDSHVYRPTGMCPDSHLPSHPGPFGP